MGAAWAQVDVQLVMQCVSTLSGAERSLSQRADVLLAAAAKDTGAQTGSVPAMRRLRDCLANSAHRAAAALKALDLARAAAAAGAAPGGGGDVQGGSLRGRALLEACEEAFASVASNMVGLWCALVDALPHMAVSSMRCLETTSRCPSHSPRLCPPQKGPLRISGRLPNGDGLHRSCVVCRMSSVAAMTTVRAVRVRVRVLGWVLVGGRELLKDAFSRATVCEVLESAMHMDSAKAMRAHDSLVRYSP